MPQCQLCQRRPHKIFSRSHSNRATIRRQHLNLHKKTVGGRKIKICTSCLKTQVKGKR